MSLNNQTTVTQATVVQEQTVPLTNVRDALHAKEAELNNDAAFRIAEIEKSAQRVIENIESQKQEILRDVQFKRQQAELQLQQAELLRREADERQRRAAELVGAAPERLGVQVKSATFADTHVSASGLQNAADQQASLHTGPSASAALLAQNRPSQLQQIPQQQTTVQQTTVQQQTNSPRMAQQQQTNSPRMAQQTMTQQQAVASPRMAQQTMTQQQAVASPRMAQQQLVQQQQSGLQTPIVQQQPAGISALSNAPLGGHVSDASLHNAQYNNNTWNNNNLNQANNLGQANTPLYNSQSTAQNVKNNIKQDIRNEEYKHGLNSPSSRNDPNANSTGFLASLKNVFMPTPPVPSDVAQQVDMQQQQHAAAMRPVGEDQALAQKTQGMTLNERQQVAQSSNTGLHQTSHISSA